MSGLFAPRANPTEPWFRIGRLEVTTVVLVVLVALVSGLAWVAAPSLPFALMYTPDALATGEVWRLVTWPFATDLSIWTVITLALFWYFGTDLERLIGHSRMAWLLVGMWAGLTAAYTLVALVLGGGPPLQSLDFIQFLLLLLWIAQYPRRPFLFSIPAWVVGVVLVGLRVLGLIAGRDGSGLLSLILSLVVVAVVARSVGLLGDYAWIPGGPTSGQRAPGHAPRPTRMSSRTENRLVSDRDRLDALLDQINAKGLNSLTDSQRRELLKLRERLRRQ